MNSVNSEIEAARMRLKTEKFQELWDYPAIAMHLESLASLFMKTSRGQRRETIAEFHDCAGKLPYLNDCDFGALVLEKEADALADAELRSFLLTEARFRARWCVQGGTAGGEVVARAAHLKRLDEKFNNLETGEIER